MTHSDSDPLLFLGLIAGCFLLIGVAYVIGCLWKYAKAEWRELARQRKR